MALNPGNPAHQEDHTKMILDIAVVKGKAGTLQIDTDKVPEHLYIEALRRGFKDMVNSKSTKITKEAYPDAEELKVAAMAKAQENLAAIMDGSFKIVGAKKAAGVSGAVMTEARRLARNLVKEEMKRQGIKISHVEAKEITKAANELIAADPSLVEQAKINVDERAKVKVAIDVKALIHESPALVAKAEAKKKAKGETLSAKQAGKVKSRAKAEAHA